MPIILGIVAAVAFVGVIALAVYNTQQDRNIRTAPTEGVETFTVLRDHVTSAANQDLGYEQTPPVGGPHNAAQSSLRRDQLRGDIGATHGVPLEL
jgi:hypothetical protein